jgi:2-polyprenyl-3-methyl-5-hydroxy-6-metoxy-1,4-benzoquinol methylase
MIQCLENGTLALEHLRQSGELPPTWQSMAELEAQVNKLHIRFLEERWRIAEKRGWGDLAIELLDRAWRTNDREYMDEEHVSEAEKVAVMQALDRQNRLMDIYNRSANMLLALCREVPNQPQRPIRVLELACGSGGLALALAEMAQRHHLSLEITASDAVLAYCEEGNAQAKAQQLPVTFRQLDAFHLTDYANEQYDITVMSQSLHHFTAGQLAVIIAQAMSQTTTAFVGTDAQRSVLLAGGVPLVASLQAIPAFALDGFISARKFYSEPELALIAESATRRCNYTISRDWPLSVLTVRGGE